ncbi:MAG: ATP-binding protein [Acidobacteriota bacterium]|nr:ATP-binding protein [Acidobacteriota bacterium]
MNDSLKRSTGWLTTIRIVVLLLILLSAILVQAGSGEVNLAVHLAINFLYALTLAAVLLALFHWTLGRRLNPTVSAYVQVLADVGISTVLVYSSGGPDSVFNFLYLVVIGASAFLLYRTGAVIIATLSALMYGTMVQLLVYGILPPPPLAPSAAADWSTARVRFNLAITVAGFYGVAFMVSYLSEKLRSARVELELRQKALYRLQNLYGNVIATMSSGLLTSDANQRVTFLNRAGGDLLGVDPGSAPGRQLADLGFVFEDWEALRNRARGRESFRGEIEMERGNARRVFGYSLRPLKESDAEEGMLVLFQDLTEMKKLERRARFSEQLAAVGELAAGIAHEIRNPLASISGSVQVLSNDLSVGSAEKRLMEIIVSESNRLSKILEDFLRFVRPQERRVAAFDVALNLSEVMDLFRLSDEVSDAHSIEVEVDPPSSELFGDRDQIRQIVYNVAKNAVRAMAAGGKLRVVGREEDAWYSIRFIDTGRGMNEEELARLFTPFSTAFDGGTGLGMAIVRRIVEDHGGAIDAESIPGEGTTVTVLLPRAVVKAATSAPQQAPEREGPRAGAA